MRLAKLQTKGVRGLADATYSFTDPRTGAPLSVAIISGGPASGKTSLLEAIAAAKEAVGAYGSPPSAKALARRGAPETQLAATWWLSPEERARVGGDSSLQPVMVEVVAGGVRTDAGPALRRLFATYSRSPDVGKLEYFPANRRLVCAAPSAFGRRLNPDAETGMRSTRHPEKYAALADAVREAAVQEAASTAAALEQGGVALRGALPDPLQGYKAAVAAMLPDVRLAGVDLGEGSGLRFMRRTKEVVGPDDLSEGEAQAVLFALAFRAFGLRGSLVLVDEPELHIHASRRVPFLHGLIGLGPDNQLIVATGAAELLNAADPGQVIDLSAPVRREVRS